jgi:hypothetical protein
MAHAEQRQFCEYVKNKFPIYFKNKLVLDCGSLDINGNNRYLFTKCDYIGVDVIAGKNVDVISPVHQLTYCPEIFDVIISTEMLEHDKYYQLSLKKMIGLLFPGGLLFFTCATEGRQEHGTTDKHPACSPGTLDYYKNITEQDIRFCLNIDKIFKEYEFKLNTDTHDLYFWGIKK